MGIKTNVKYKNGYYGISKQQPDGKYKFCPLGKLPVLEEVLECLEDGKIYLKLSTPFYGRQKITYISQGDLSDSQLCKDLADLGFDVTKALSNHFVDVIRLQAEAIERINTIKLYIKDHLGRLPLNTIKNTNIQTWINTLSQNRLSPKTIRNAYNLLNPALEKAVVLGMLPRNPCVGTVLPKLQKPQTNVYNIAGIQNALAAADDISTYLLILLGASVGLRRGEMAALLWKDVDLVKNTVSVYQSRVHTSQGIIEKAPKTQAGKRIITIGHDVANALRDAKAIYDDAVANKPGFKDYGYVLFKENGEPFHPDSLTQKWERFVAKHGLPPIRLHDLRHSNATAMIAAGINAKVVQHRLGHANVSITLNTYTHVLPEMDQEAADTLNNALFSSAQPISCPRIIY